MPAATLKNRAIHQLSGHYRVFFERRPSEGKVAGIGRHRMTGHREFVLRWAGGLRQPDRMVAVLSYVGRRSLLR